ncbi:MAG: hypothetical protein Q4A28_05985 [Brachymonas sp.]|nr:hypothetical protein [Brachymonas sp.]
MKKLIFLAVIAAIFPAHASIYKCGRTYTDKPCQGAQTVKIRSASGGVDVQDILLECRKDDGHIWYDTTECPEDYQQIARHPVPANLSVKDKIYIVEMRKQGRRNINEHEQRSALGIAPGQIDKAKTPNCKSIAEQIKRLDKRMRQPQSASSMSKLNEQRRKLSDRRFRECR